MKTHPIMGPGLCAGLFLALFLQGCASAGHLAEYEYQGRKLAVVTTAPPHPEVFTSDFWNPEARGWLGALLEAGSAIAREAKAEEARETLEKAAETTDVSTLMSAQVLEQGARLLRARSVSSVGEADFEIEIEVQAYGIRANSWDSQADFFIEAKVFLLDSATGREIWDATVQAQDPIQSTQWGAGGAVGNIITAKVLADLTVEEAEMAFEGLAEFSSRAVTRKLRDGLEKAGVR